jgi:hypothetical protein
MGLITIKSRLIKQFTKSTKSSYLLLFTMNYVLGYWMLSSVLVEYYYY